jgi:hypothetical protein
MRRTEEPFHLLSLFRQTPAQERRELIEDLEFHARCIVEEEHGPWPERPADFDVYMGTVELGAEAPRAAARVVQALRRALANDADPLDFAEALLHWGDMDPARRFKPGSGTSQETLYVEELARKHPEMLPVQLYGIAVAEAKAGGATPFTYLKALEGVDLFKANGEPYTVQALGQAWRRWKRKRPSE